MGKQPGGFRLHAVTLWSALETGRSQCVTHDSGGRDVVGLRLIADRVEGTGRDRLSGRNTRSAFWCRWRVGASILRRPFRLRELRVTLPAPSPAWRPRNRHRAFWPGEHWLRRW